jgi:FAD:protein FMN transferase
MRAIILSSWILIFGSFSTIAQPAFTAKKSLMMMGCAFELAATSDDEAVAWQAINEGINEISRIEKLISSWDAQSQTSEVNRMAGVRPVKVDKELYDLIYRAKKVSTLTDGAFDISFASMNKIWHFDRTDQTLPDGSIVNAARAKIDYQRIILNPADTSIYLSEGMRIGFGAIGKGYAANKAKQVMSAISGVEGGVVNASGDVLTWGQSPTAEGWRISISNPKKKEQPIAWLQADDMAIVTSGDYEKYFMSGNKRYAHIIDPTTGITSVTIICPNAELADALATSVFVLGIKNGIELIDKMNNIECIIIDDDGTLYQSKNLKLNYY